MIRRFRVRLLIATVVLLPGCRALDDGTQSVFGEECTSSETVYGCVDIRGTVTNGTGAPYEGIDVGPTPGTDVHGLTALYVNTAADGKYEVRMFQLDPNAPKTFELSLKATQRNNAGTEIKSRIVTVQVSPSDVNEIPDPVVANFVIQ